MNIYNNLNDLPIFKNAVITIGSFDGVHKGHQKLLQKIQQLAQKINGESVVITFHPHPRLVLNPNDTSLKLLTTIEEKIYLLEKYGVDNVVVVPFSLDFSKQTPDEYIANFLVKKFQARYIIIGYDHRFGAGRKGDINYLRKYESTYNYKVIEIEKHEVEDIAVSSTKVRKAIESASITTANRLLAHPFMLTGTVIQGQKIGKEIGFPTANLSLNSKHKILPPIGVYAVLVEHQGQTHQGMFYIGNRPTLPDLPQQTLEVNIFDFDKNIYGDKIRLLLVERIRGDQKFDGLPALKQQLGKDKVAALDILKKKQEQTDADSKFQVNHAPSVAVVILNYNGLDFLKDFLPSVVKTVYPNLQIVVADNCSTDESLIWLETFKNSNNIQLISLAENRGYAGGYNQALKAIHSDYYILLNSDVEVPSNWLTPLIQLLEEKPAAAACQPKILDYNQKDQFEYAGAAGGWLDKWGYPFCKGRIFSTIEKDQGQYDQATEIFWASGAAFAIKAQLFDKIGGFDEDYFAHQEEIDLCWRLKNAGYQIYYQPKSIVYHVGGGTLDYNNPNKTFLNFRNSLFNLVKNEAKPKLRWLVLWRLILDGVAALRFLLQGKFKHIWAILRSHGDFYKHYFQLRKNVATIKNLCNLSVFNLLRIQLGNMKKVFYGNII